MPATTEPNLQFTPGDYWTRERADLGVAAMLRTWNSPEMQTLMNDIATADDMDEVAGSGGIAASVTATFRVDSARLTWRRARRDDIPAMAQLIVAGHLPPFFIDEWLGGFVVAEQDGVIVACGGAEIYGSHAVLRSIVVDEAARGLSLGRKLAELLEEDAVLAGATDIYLFTADAHEFWQHLGFEDVTLDDWAEEPRASWQWQFMRRFGDTFSIPVFTMRKNV